MQELLPNPTESKVSFTNQSSRENSIRKKYRIGIKLAYNSEDT